MKAKLHLSNMMLEMYGFNDAVNFLNTNTDKINRRSLLHNIFSHSSNPILSMCLLYEFVQKLIEKFPSLSNDGRVAMKKLMVLAYHYVDFIDEENFLNDILEERDYSGRDSLRLAVSLELLELIQHPKVEAVTKKLYNSGYQQQGTLFEMSTTYQMVFQTEDRDIESLYRFYKARDFSNVPQVCWQLGIFKESIKTRIIARGFTIFVLLILSIVTFELQITLQQSQNPYLKDLMHYREILVQSNNIT